jgi:hypothetical protein
MVQPQQIPLFSAQYATLKKLVDEKFALVEAFKTKKNIGYNSRFEGVIPIFLIPNHVLRKTQKKF